MTINEKIFKEVAEKMNNDFNFEQFKSHNKSLYDIIIASMKKAQKEYHKKIINLNEPSLIISQYELNSDERFGRIKNYKKGDIVVWRGGHPCIGIIEKGILNKNTKKTTILDEICYYINKSHNSLNYRHIRLATKHEIETLNKRKFLLISKPYSE